MSTEYRLVRQRLTDGPVDRPSVRYGLYMVSFEKDLSGVRPVAMSPTPAACVGETPDVVRGLIEQFRRAVVLPILDEVLFDAATTAPWTGQYRWKDGITCRFSAEAWVAFVTELRASLGRHLTAEDILRHSNSALASLLRDEFRWDEAGTTVAQAWRARRVESVCDRGRNPALYSTISAEARDQFLATLRFNVGREPTIEDMLEASRPKTSLLYKELRWEEDPTTLAYEWRVLHATELLSGVEEVTPAPIPTVA